MTLQLYVVWGSVAGGMRRSVAPLRTIKLADDRCYNQKEVGQSCPTEGGRWPKAPMVFCGNILPLHNRDWIILRHSRRVVRRADRGVEPREPFVSGRNAQHLITIVVFLRDLLFFVVSLYIVSGW